LRIVITGAAGQVAYSFLHPLCKGDVFGIDQVLKTTRSNNNRHRF